MNITQNLKAFLKKLPLNKMSGHQKYLAVSANLCRGKTDIGVLIKEVKSEWRKSVLGIKYSYTFYDRAQSEGWLNPSDDQKGKFFVTSEGLEHLKALESPTTDVEKGELKKVGTLTIINRKGAHSFDKNLRNIFAAAKHQVLIADSYVDGGIFDSVLDVIPKTTNLKMLYANPSGNFQQRAARFSKEYTKFTFRRYKWLHDRFIIIDNTGYILGPSIKDAASKYPALVVQLGGKEKVLLQEFFDELWKKGKTE